MHKIMGRRAVRCWMCGILVLMLALVAAPVVSADDAFPQSAKSYLIQRDGATLWASEPDLRLPPASLTKIMTALIALERGKLDRIVAVSAAAAAETGSRMGLREGDLLTLRDLLAGMLIKSANDAAHAVAEGVAGDLETFILMMNARAATLGMRDTHYADVSGHDTPEHYTTARDLVKVAEVAMLQPLFRELVASEKLKVTTIDKKRTFRLQTSNRLVGVFPGLTGVKTGYTKGAGRCLVAMAERDGKLATLVLLNAPKRWRDAPRMLESALADPPLVVAAAPEAQRGKGARSHKTTRAQVVKVSTKARPGHHLPHPTTQFRGKPLQL